MKISENKDNQFTNKFSVPDPDNKIDKNIEKLLNLKPKGLLHPLPFEKEVFLSIIQNLEEEQIIGVINKHLPAPKKNAPQVDKDNHISKVKSIKEYLSLLDLDDEAMSKNYNKFRKASLEGTYRILTRTKNKESGNNYLIHGTLYGKTENGEWEAFSNYIDMSKECSDYYYDFKKKRLQEGESVFGQESGLNLIDDKAFKSASISTIESVINDIIESYKKPLLKRLAKAECPQLFVKALANIEQKSNETRYAELFSSATSNKKRTKKDLNAILTNNTEKIEKLPSYKEKNDHPQDSKDAMAAIKDGKSTYKYSGKSHNITYYTNMQALLDVIKIARSAGLDLSEYEEDKKVTGLSDLKNLCTKLDIDFKNLGVNKKNNDDGLKNSQ